MITNKPSKANQEQGKRFIPLLSICRDGNVPELHSGDKLRECDTGAVWIVQGEWYEFSGQWRLSIHLDDGEFALRTFLTSSYESVASYLVLR